MFTFPLSFFRRCTLHSQFLYGAARMRNARSICKAQFLRRMETAARLGGGPGSARRIELPLYVASRNALCTAHATLELRDLALPCPTPSIQISNGSIPLTIPETC